MAADARREGADDVSHSCRKDVDATHDQHVVGGFVPRLSAHARLRTSRDTGVKQEPPLSVAVELAAGVEPDAGLAETIRERIRAVLVVQTHVELVPWGSLERSEYKGQLIER